MKLFINKKYLVLPIGYHTTKKKLEFYIDDSLVFDLDVNLDFIDPDYYQYLNIERFYGQELEITCPQMQNITLELTDEVPMDGVYEEKYRPQVRFSAIRGWINDPNGLVYYDGQYHLFFQHNPAGSNWGNMHWGHAVSKDLVNWQELECALHPDEMGTMFSGSAIVDRDNVTGLKENDNDVILLFYTAAGGTSKLSEGAKFTQCIAYSTDGGRNFSKYENNPIISHIVSENRDPKVIYSPELESYVMALYLKDNRFALFTSKNLLKWDVMHEVILPDDAECPDFYFLNVDGDKNNTKWVFSGASDRYLVGNIEKGVFLPSQPPKRLHYGKNSYAAQTYSDIPEEDGRRIRIAWNTMHIPNSYFNCSMCTPTEMSLKTINDEVFLCAWPIKEIEKLYAGSIEISNTVVGNLYLDAGEKSNTVVGKLYLDADEKSNTAVASKSPSDSVGKSNTHVAKMQSFVQELNGKAFDIELDITADNNSEFTISLLGMDIECKTHENQLQLLNNTMPLYIKDGKIKLRLIVDVNGIEIFVDRGQAFMCVGFICDYNLNYININTQNGHIKIDSAKIRKLNKSGFNS